MRQIVPLQTLIILRPRMVKAGTNDESMSYDVNRECHSEIAGCKSQQLGNNFKNKKVLLKINFL